MIHTDGKQTIANAPQRCERCRHEVHEGQCRAQVGTGYMGYVRCACVTEGEE